MKNQTARLAALLALCLQKNTCLPVTQQELFAVLEAMDATLVSLPFCCTDPGALANELNKAVTLLANLAFSLRNGAIILPAKKLLLSKINGLCNKSTHLIRQVGGPPPQLPALNLTAPAAFKKALSDVWQLLYRNEQIKELFTILEPSLQTVITNRESVYYNWAWWSAFVCAVIQNPPAISEDLEALLVNLNYNTLIFIQYLAEKLNKQLLQMQSAAEKIDYLALEYIRFKHCMAANPCVPARPSLASTMLPVIKMHIAVVNEVKPAAAAMPALTTKTKTALSVPQLALFIRLIVDMKIIHADNHTSLLKTIAAVVSTPKVNDISAESLRNNFYTPNRAAREIMKDYLVGMLNLLKTY